MPTSRSSARSLVGLIQEDAADAGRGEILAAVLDRLASALVEHLAAEERTYLPLPLQNASHSSH